MEKLRVRDSYIFQFYYRGLHHVTQSQPGAKDHFDLLKDLSKGTDRGDAYKFLLLQDDSDLHKAIHLELNLMTYNSFWYKGKKMAELAAITPQLVKKLNPSESK